MKKSAIFLLTIFACYGASPEKEGSKPNCTEPVCLAPVQMTLSHNFGKGVGHKGYSSADFFLIKTDGLHFYPFIDFRFHEMDEGRTALNVGAGFRRPVWQDRLSVGANLYYDYRNSYKLKTHQAGAGFELLSQHLDFRLNGYVPFNGKKQSERCKFFNFSQHQINVRRKTHYAFPSANAEFGLPLTWMNSKHVSSYLGVGPYYLFGKNVSGNRYPSSWGGKFRAEVDVTDYLGLKFELNHDRIFGTTCQGVIAINIPLYKKSACSTACVTTGKQAYLKRTLRPVMRNEIIPVKKKSHTSKLRDKNGDVIQAFFVNNLAACPGLGTFESPFCTLAGANIAPSGPVLVYVFEGMSPTVPYTGSFVMKEGQILQGSGTSLVTSGVVIPPQTSGRPVITSGVAPAVVLASSTLVQGLTIESPGQIGIAGTSLSNVKIVNNIINQAGVRAIEINDHLGSLYIAGNTIQNAASSGIFVELSGPHSVGYIRNNTISSPTGNFDIGTLVTQGTMTIEFNQINSNTSFGIHAYDGKQTIQNNQVNNGGLFGLGILYDLSGSGPGPNESYIYNNTVNTTDTGSVGIRSSSFNGAGIIYTEVIGNTAITANPTAGIVVEALNNAGPSAICASITGNTSNNFIRVDGQQGPVNVQQTLAEFTSENIGPTQVYNTVNFGSSCTAP
jgi:hypothetical protein